LPAVASRSVIYTKACEEFTRKILRKNVKINLGIEPRIQRFIELIESRPRAGQLPDSEPKQIPDPIDVPKSVLEDIFRHARESFPNECCGWLTGAQDANTADGVRRAVNAYEPDLHPTAKDRTAERAFVISDGDLLELSRSLDDEVRPRIIYHSHPNGRAYFSPTDRANARDPWGEGPAYPVQQIVIGIDGARVVEARQFAWSDEADDFVEIAEYPGLDI
jgi:proteasome lid subunit RPN8/RPN11